jgi:hypothetical protein
MINNNEIKLHRAYAYKNNTVVVYGFGQSEAGVELVIFKSLFSEEPLVTVGKRIEFLNHATILENMNDYRNQLALEKQKEREKENQLLDVPIILE